MIRRGVIERLSALGFILLVSLPLSADGAGRGTSQRVPTLGLRDDIVIALMQSTVKDYVAARLSKSAEAIDVKGLSPILSDLSREDRLTIKTGSEEVDQRGLVGRAVFLMSVKKENGSERHHWVTGEVSVIREVLVANRLIPRKTFLTAESLSLATIYQTQLEQQYFETGDDLMGKRAIHAILPGEPITLRRIEDAPIIRRGDRVTLVVKTQGVRITGLGHAKKDGFLGRQLDVVVQNSNKIISGTVISASEILVATGHGG